MVWSCVSMCCARACFDECTLARNVHVHAQTHAHVQGQARVLN